MYVCGISKLLAIKKFKVSPPCPTTQAVQLVTTTSLRYVIGQATPLFRYLYGKMFHLWLQPNAFGGRALPGPAIGL